MLPARAHKKVSQLVRIVDTDDFMDSDMNTDMALELILIFAVIHE
jgi:hypothetical protein